MSSRFSANVLTLLWLHAPIVFGQAHFKRFPEAVTNDDAYVLGWGLKNDPAGGVDSKTEIVADGPEKRVVIDAVIGALSSKKPDAPSYSFEILFDVKGNLDAPQLELASAKSVSDELGRDSGDNEIEARLNNAYHKLTTTLPPRDRESLKQEQLKWLATREHITAAEKDEKEDHTAPVPFLRK